MMGDRFYLSLNCAYCGKTSEVYYAPTCGFYDFVCREDTNEQAKPKDGCGKKNFITASFDVKKLEDVTEEDVISAFEMATTADHSLDAIRRNAKSYLKNIRKEK